jgi:seryl-tRNA synthetase
MFKEKIWELQQYDQLHTLMWLDGQYKFRIELLSSVIDEARERISSGRYNNIDELLELRNALPKGEKRFQALTETKKEIKKDINELLYLLN